MNKADLVEELSNQTGLTKRTSREAVDAITSVITDALGTQEKVTFGEVWNFSGYGKKGKKRSESSNKRNYSDPS